MEEVEAMFNGMENRTPIGVDGVTAEMLKAEETNTPRSLKDTFRHSSDCEETSETWKIVLLFKLSKQAT